MIGTCELNGINPQAWLADTLAHLAAGHNAVGAATRGGSVCREHRPNR